MRKINQIAAILLLGASQHALASEAGAESAFAKLRAGYAAGDAALATSAYSENAHYIELYPEVDPVIKVGQVEIEKNFQQLFANLGMASAENPIDLNFRLLSDTPLNSDVRRGYFRLRVGLAPSTQHYYGKFSAIVQDQRFAFDASSIATLEEFEQSEGAILFLPDDEILAPEFYDALLGTYQIDGCNITLTRSSRRLFALNECTSEWRGLTRRSGLHWQAGSTLIAEATKQTYRFGTESPQTTLTMDAQKPAVKQQLFTKRNVQFGESPKLAGTLFLPAGVTEKRPAVVLVHGSGPQDRYGYASIIELLAQSFARSGIAVLSYDKRGVGQSEGNVSSAGFSELAADATEAMRFLRNEPSVDAARVGLAGSSQAGWVVASAIQNGAQPAFTLLLGAAGSAITVETQNLYNTEVMMRCSGIEDDDIELALQQQRAFFDAKRNPNAQSALTKISQSAQQRPVLRDWLFPSNVDVSAAPQWFDVLDLDFDPLPVWQRYPGQAFFLFADQDDSTPTKVALARLPSLPNAHILTLRGAQHLGLQANSLCDSLESRTQFHPDFFKTLQAWSKQIVEIEAKGF